MRGKLRHWPATPPTTGNTNSLVSFDWVAPIFLTWSSPLHWITPDLKTFLSHVTGLLLFSRLSDALISIERLAAASEVLNPSPVSLASFWRFAPIC